MIDAGPGLRGKSGRAATAGIDLTPGPEGPLTVEVECRTSPRARKGALHEITIEADWTVTTPHDLEAERVAAAFGGYTSCLTLVDETIPAFRESLALLTRRIRPALVRDGRGAWRPALEDRVVGCCTTARFRTVEKAARHLRSLPHLTAIHDVPGWQLGQVVDGAQRVWRAWEGMRRPSHELTRLVREVGGIAELWRSGIRPDQIVQMAAHVEVVEEPLPIAYFIGLAYGGADPEWVGQVIRHRPQADVAAWLANLEVDHTMGDAETWGRWLAYGLPRDDVLAMVASGVDPDLVEEVAGTIGWTRYKVARTLAEWTRVDTRPTAADFEVLARHRVMEVRFPSELIDEILDEVGQLVRDAIWEPVALTRTEVAVMFAVLGTRQGVLAAARAGVRGSEGLDRYVSERDSA